MVTVWAGASSAAGAVHDHVPLLVPVGATAPREALSATVSPSGSEKVPLFAAAVPSGTLTALVSAATTGGWLAATVATHVLNAKSCPHWAPVNHAQPLQEMYSCPPAYVSKTELVYQVKAPTRTRTTIA